MQTDPGEEEEEEEEEEDVVGLLEAHPRRHPMSGHELSQAVGALQEEPLEAVGGQYDHDMWEDDQEDYNQWSNPDLAIRLGVRT